MRRPLFDLPGAKCLILLFCLIGSVDAVAGNPPYQDWRHCTLTFAGEGKTVTMANVPVADTWPRQHQGLSGRSQAGDQFMLFVWPHSEPRVVWMHDTPVPLDAGFIDGKGRLFQVEPMTANTDTYHYSRAPAEAILEVGHGAFDQLGIREGWVMLRHACSGGGRPPLAGGPAG